MATAKNCWEFKNCGREIGGSKIKEIGICPASPNHGRDCWMAAGTFCGGKVQGTEAQKRGTCMSCDWYKTIKKI
jgi:hypothetical protein